MATVSTAPDTRDTGGVVAAASLGVDAVAQRWGTSTDSGLSQAEAALRLRRDVPNAVASHRARRWPVLWHQLRSPLLEDCSWPPRWSQASWASVAGRE